MSKIWAIIPAAGSGQRMQSDTPKQYLELGGSAILDMTIKAVLQDKRVQSVVVCLAADDENWSKLKAAQSQTSSNKVLTTIGGATRAQSVLNGLDSLAKLAQDEDWVLVHDAARPFLDSSLLAKFIDATVNSDTGAILATQCSDSVKLSSSGDQIERSLQRDQIWLAQTPQMFPYAILKKVLRQSIQLPNQQGELITDEASAMEAAGYLVNLVQGDKNNIKITTPEDIDYAEYLLSSGSTMGRRL